MAIANPFAGPRPLSLNDPIFGRDREIAELRHLLSAERIVLLHSPSGAGKSSLVNAGLIPQMLDRFDVWLPTRVNAQPPPEPAVSNRYAWSAAVGFEQELPEDRRRTPETFAMVTLKEYVEQRPRRPDVPPNILLVFDQFEEILRVAPADSAGKREFFRQLGELLIDPGIWALFVLREDYLAPLDPYARLVPTHLRNRYRLDVLGKEGATEAIRETARSGGRKFTGGALNELVDNLAAVQVQSPDGTFAPQVGEYVEPLQLQVACRRLWDELPEDLKNIGLEQIRQYGKVSEALSGYYADVVRKVAGDDTTRERAIREWIGGKLIRDGVRDQVRKGGHSTEGLDNQLIDGPSGLVDSHLLRSEPRGGSYYFELAHDRLIEPVGKNNREWFDAHLSQLQKVAALWEAQGRPPGLLVTGGELTEAQRWAATQTSLTLGEEKFLAASVEAQAAVEKERRQARRLRRLAIVSTAVGVLALAAGGVATWQYREADKEKHKAQVALASSAVQDGTRLVEQGQQGQAAAYMAFAVRTAPDSLAATSWISALLLNVTWWVPRDSMQHQAAVKSAAFSPDGRRVVTVSDDKTARVWDAETGKPVGEPMEHQDWVMSAAFSPDGRFVVTASEDKTARVWEADTGKPVGTPLQHLEVVNSAAFSLDGRFVVTASDDKTARVWEADTGKPAGAPLQHQGAVNSAAFSPDGRRVVTASNDTTARVWEADTGKPVGATLQHLFLVNSAAFSRDGRRVVTASNDKTARVWEADTGKPVGEPMEHQDWVMSAAFSPDGRWVVTASEDKTARVWEADTGKPVGAPLQHQAAVSSAVFSPDGRRVVTASSDKTARVWETDTGQPVGSPMQHPDAVTSAVFSPDGRRVVTASNDKTARVWAADAGKPAGATLQHQDSVRSAVFSPDGRRVVTASEDNLARLWAADTGEPVGATLQHLGVVWSAVFSPDGRRVVTASGDKTAQVWVANTGKLVGAPLQHQGLVRSAGFSPDGRRVVTASEDKTARVWEADTGKPVGVPLRHENAVLSAAFSPDGRRVVTASRDKTARVWEADTGNPVGATLQHLFLVNSAAFSPDGRRVVTASFDRTAQVWEADTGKPVGATLQHQDSVNSAAFSPDGRRVVTASEDNTAQVWEADTGKPVGSPLRHQGKVNSAAFSPDGRRVVTASDDKTARVWEADTGKPVGSPLPHLDKVMSAVFSPDGRRVVTASDDKTARVWVILLDCCALKEETDRLASLAEAVSGLQVSETGSLSPMTPDTHRKILEELARPRGTTSPPLLSVDWLIDRFRRK